MKYLLFLLISTISYSQVGINTTQPTKTLDINGELRVRELPLGDNTDYILVANTNGDVRKIPISSLQLDSHKCPNLIKSESSEYNLTFKSDYSIPKPNTNPIIHNTNFTVAGTWIQDNKYIYKYSNTTGVSFNINIPFTVQFDTLVCNYN